MVITFIEAADSVHLFAAFPIVAYFVAFGSGRLEDKTRVWPE